MEERYKTLMRRVRFYLIQERRKKTRMGRMLSARVFDEHLWKWEKRGVATGAAWGAACAIAPVPMQSLFGVAACLWRKGNIPVAILMAWISFPGYQVFAWPVQWWVGSVIFAWLGLPGSGATLGLVKDSAMKVPACVESWNFDGLLQPLQHVHFGWAIAEFAFGCVVTCVLFGVVCYWLVQAGWHIGIAAKSWFRRRRGR